MEPIPAVDLGRGRPLVFLHGWSTNAGFFAAQHALAGPGRRVIVPDLPGHGRCRTVGTPPAFPDLAAAVAALLARPGMAGAVLVGWSMGAIVALDVLAARGCAGIAGLVMVDMTPKVATAPGWSLGLRNGGSVAELTRIADGMAMAWPAYAARIVTALFAPGVAPDGALYRSAARAIADNDGATMAGLWRGLVAADHRATVAALPIPVLALAGAQSQLYAPEVAQWIAAHAPRGRCAAIADAGHAPHLEAPDAFNAAIATFAAELEPAPTAPS